MQDLQAALAKFLQGKDEVNPNEIFTYLVEEDMGGAISQSPASVERIMTMLGYSSEYTMKDGVRRLVYKRLPPIEEIAENIKNNCEDTLNKLH